MTKLNNKGISLVELLIEVAVMALLISPIILQTATTLNTSAASKERQYAVESAEEVIEYFRKTDSKDIASMGDADGVVDIQSYTTTDDINCVIIDSAGGPDKTIKYSSTDYTLDSAKLGKKHNEYTRTVSISDLNNKISEAGYEIDYSSYVKGSSLPEISDGSGGNKLDGFEIGSDNTVAKYDSNNHIVGILCKKKDKSIIDPNTVSLGNIQDIDSSKMAIITGDATTLDYQLEKDLNNLLYQFAVKNPTSALGQYIDNPDKLNSYISSILTNQSSAKRTRLIHITVQAGRDNSGNTITKANGKPKYYEVKCDVIYKVQFSDVEIDGKNVSLKVFDGNSSTTGQLKYNVLDRKYYVDSPPDIYFVYEPLLISTKTGPTVHTDYVHQDYIGITTDKYTCGNVTGYDPSKIYMIKSTENWSKANNTLSNTETLLDQYKNCYYYYTGSSYHWVVLNVNQIKSSKFTDSAPDTQLPIQIVTNISSYNNGTSLLPGGIAEAGSVKWLQFGVSSATDDSPSSEYNVATDPDTPAKPIKTSLCTNRFAYAETLTTVKDSSGNNADSIVPWANDSRYEGLLYRMQVTYTKVSNGEKIYLTGAKGAY